MGRICLSCSAPTRDELDEELVDLVDRHGSPEKVPWAAVLAVADRHDLHPGSVKRHALGHLEKGGVTERAGHLAAVVARAARPVTGSSPKELITELEEVAVDLQAALAVAAGSAREVASLSTALRRCVMDRARLLGYLDRGCPEPEECPPVVESPEFSQLVARVLAPLHRWPDARAAVLAAVASLQGAAR